MMDRKKVVIDRLFLIFNKIWNKTMNRNSMAIIFGICCGVATLVYLSYDSPSEPKDAEAQYELGETYWYGKGVPLDKAEAVKWFRKAAQQGYAPAQGALGLAYSAGKGVAKNKREAINLWRKAAEQGYASAQFALGLEYWSGKFLTQNHREAYIWLFIAKTSGDEMAVNTLNSLNWYLSQSEIREAQKEARHRLNAINNRNQ